MAGNELRGMDEYGNAVWAEYEVLGRGDCPKVAGGLSAIGELGEFFLRVGCEPVLAKSLKMVGVGAVGKALLVWRQEGARAVRWREVGLVNSVEYGVAPEIFSELAVGEGFPDGGK